MKNARAIGFLTVAGLVIAAPDARAVDQGKALYVGGTLAGVKEKSEAAIDLKGDTHLRFLPPGTPPVEVPWTGIEEIEYGQKVGHRVKTAIFLTPLALFSKSRHHYVTLAWKDAAGASQAAVFEFDKNDIRPALAVLRVRSGKEIAYQDDQAKKQMGAATEK